MAVLQIQTESRCKICRAPQRSEIEHLLELRSSRGRLDDGRLVTQKVVLEHLVEWGIENPTLDNINNHWRKHCEVVDEQTKEEVEELVKTVHAEMLAEADSSDGTLDGDLRAIWRIGFLRIKQRLQKGEDPGISLDHALKAAGELTKRKDNDAKHSLLTALAGGIQMSLDSARPPKQIEGAEVIDAEAVES